MAAKEGEIEGRYMYNKRTNMMCTVPDFVYSETAHVAYAGIQK
jgi:hypothetical protein